MNIKIKSQFDDRIPYECEAESMLVALQVAVKSDAYLHGADLHGADLHGANLRGAYLSGAYLHGADLSGANLSDANLRDANLRGANLSGAYLSDANLRGADLRDANLRGANLSGAYLSDANLRGAKINWQSHALLGEILRRAAGDDVQRRCLAGGILISTDWCWPKMLSIDHPDKAWALAELSKWVQDGDDAPAAIRKNSIASTNI